MSALAQDLRHGLRLIQKAPGFAAAAVVLMALGIGANTAIFTVVNAVLLRPLPFPEPDRLVRLWHVPPAKSFPGLTTFSVSPANYLDWRSQSRSFLGMAAYGLRELSMTGGDRPEAVTAALVGSDFFRVVGVPPALGRTFTPDEDRPGGGHVVVLANAFWRRRFAADPRIVGRKLSLDGQSFVVVGVMPPTLDFPAWGATGVPLWAPLAWTETERAVRGIHDYSVIARLKPGVGLRQAQAEMDAISSRLARQYPADDQGWGATVAELPEYLVRSVRPALMILLGAVAFVLLIACANVANLTLAKSLGRQKEMAIRSALGASQGRMLGQALAESTLLALAGGALGLVVAHFGVALIVAFLSTDLPRAIEIGLDGRILAFALAVSLASGLLAGLAPALRMTRTDLNETLKAGLGRTDADSGGHRTRGALVALEVALSLVLLVGAGLMVRSLWELRGVDPGFDPRGVLTMTVALPETRYPLPAERDAFAERVLERLRALPGVLSAAAVDSLPLTGGSTQPVVIAGRPAGLAAEQPEVAVRRASPGYLRAMRIRLERGRDVLASDRAGAAAVVLVSESMAKRFWPGEDPLGKRLTLTFAPETSRQVVGVVADVKQHGLDAPTSPATVYTPLPQGAWERLSLVLRTRGSRPAALAPAATAAIHEIDREESVQSVLTMEEILSDTLSQRRFSMLLLAAFAGLALVLAAVGIYSVLSYSVGRRVREIGIRMALGAEVRHVLRLIVVEGMRPTLLGMAVGLAGALALGRLLASLLYGVTASDPATLAAVSLILLAVALLASLLPAYRAARIEPIKAIGAE
jgi:putative ABC transport system permease protein